MLLPGRRAYLFGGDPLSLPVDVESHFEFHEGIHAPVPLFSPDLRETPKEAEIVSDRLMLRAGMMRQEASAFTHFFPLASGFSENDEIVREEKNRAGAIELLMPTIQSAKSWRESGRYEAYGKEMLRFKDRHEREMLYRRTNEEMINEIFGPIGIVQGPAAQPLSLQWKFRDEVRPRRPDARP